MNIGLVTGAGSFVGASIASFLAREFGVVIATFRSPTPWSRMLYADPFVTLLQGDLNHANFASHLPPEINFVVHCAATTDNDDPKELKRGNIDATRNLVGAVSKTNCKLWIQLSTISVHGDDFNGVISERTPINDPRPYGVTKRSAEKLLEDASEHFAVRCLRLPAVLGPGACNHWPSRILGAALVDQPITIFNTTKPFNNAVHVDDLARFVHALSVTSHEGFDAFPIASTDPISIAQAAQCVIDAVCSRSVVTVDPTPRPSFYIDDSYARHRYGYNSRSISLALRDYASL